MIQCVPLHDVVQFGLYDPSVAAALGALGVGVLAVLSLRAIAGLVLGGRTADRPARAALRWLSAFARFRTP